MGVHWRYLLLIALLAGLPAGCGKHSNKPEEEAKAQVPVQVTTVETGTLVKTVSASGSIYALNDVLLAPKIPGKVARVHVKEGESVRQGQLLVALEDKEARAGRDQALAGVASAEARLKQAREGYSLQKEQTSTQTAQALAMLEAARSRLKQAESGALITEEAVQAQTAQAAAAVAAAQANLDALRRGAREQEKKQAELAVAQARANRDNAKADYDRAQSLLASGALSQQQVDAARLRYEVAEAQLEAAVQQQQLVYEGPRTEQIRAAEQQLKQAEALYQQALANQRQNELRRQEIETARTGVVQAEAAYELAKATVAQNVIREKDIALAEAGLTQARAALVMAEQNLAATRLTAPVSGGIADLEVDVGEMVSPAMPILRLVTSGVVSFKGHLSEADVEQVQVGARAELRVPALGEEKFPGQVIKVMPAGDPESHTFLVKVALAAGERRLKPGMFAEAAIVLREVRDMPIIPLDAVLQRDNKMSVFRVVAGVAREATIVAELVVKDKVAVASGVSAGDRVVVSGQRSLKGGETVVVVGE